MTTVLRTWVINTVAGVGTPGYAGDGAAAVSASLNEPKGLALDHRGLLYIADSENHLVRRVDLRTGIMTTVAGRAEGPEVPARPTTVMEPTDWSGEDPLAEPAGAAPQSYTQQADLSGTVRYLAPGAALTKRFSGDGGPAAEAQLNFPTALALDGEGTLFIADTMNHRVRRVDPATGIITTLAGTGQPRYAGDGGPADQAALNEPAALACDGQGRLFIADQSNNRVRVVDLKTGRIGTVAGTGRGAYYGDGGPAEGAGLAGPSGLYLRGATLYIADTFNGRIRTVDLDNGTIQTVVGDGGEYRFQAANEPPSASLSRPSGLCVDGEGRVYVTDSDSHLIRVWRPGQPYVVRIAGIGIASDGGDGGPSLHAGLNYPFGLTIDHDEALFVADTFNHRIRRLSLA